MKTGILGRADLLRVIRRGQQAEIDLIARQLGLALEQPSTATPQAPITTQQDPAAPPTVADIPAQDLRLTPFWQAHHFEQRVHLEQPPERIETTPVTWQNRPTQAPRWQPLCRQNVLQPRLHKALDQHRHTRQLDVRAVVRQLGQGEWLHRLPYQQRRRCAGQIHIIDDRSDHLIPYWQDHDALLRWLLPRYAANAVAYASFREGLSEPRLLGAAPGAAYVIPPVGTVILILSDLGTLLQDHGHTTQRWLRFGRKVQLAGQRPLVLMPQIPHQTHALQPYFNLLGWQAKPCAQNPGSSPQSPLAHLLTLISPAIRLEPGFVRAVRRLAGLAIGVESALWQDAALSSQSSVAATLHPDEAKRWRAAFATQPQALQHKVLDCLSRWRAKLPAEIWFEEVLSLTEHTRAHCLPADDVAQSVAFFTQLGQQLRGVGNLTPVPGSSAWFCRAEKRFSEPVWQNPKVGDALKKLSHHLHKNDPTFEADYAIDPALVTDDTLPLQRCYVAQQGAHLCLSPTPDPANGSPLGCIAYRLPELNYAPDLPNVKLLPASDNHTIPLPAGGALRLRSDCEQLDCRTIHPTWAEATGRDEGGLWADIHLQTPTQTPVVQRLRWIPPGAFTQGSPDTEPGRYEDEGPLQAMVLEHGFWLFDTPVTQALWQAVMGGNPSHFKSPQRPVESIRWTDAQAFMQTLNQRYPDLHLVLPSETQWEYACRAGTQTATYAGPMVIRGQRNAPVLDDIAWYGGNSGVDFELDNGQDTTDWPEKQHAQPQAGTHPVAQKRCNSWGLYDMLGNVWEWCEDAKQDYPQTPESDVEMDAERRVLRGGSWGDYARGVRAAYRLWDRPGLRDDNLGFRGARVQHEPSQAGGTGQAQARKEAFTSAPASAAAGVGRLRKPS